MHFRLKCIAGVVCVFGQIFTCQPVKGLVYKHTEKKLTQYMLSTVWVYICPT